MRDLDNVVDKALTPPVKPQPSDNICPPLLIGSCKTLTAPQYWFTAFTAVCMRTCGQNRWR